MQDFFLEFYRDKDEFLYGKIFFYIFYYTSRFFYNKEKNEEVT